MNLSNAHVPYVLATCGFLGYLFPERAWRWCIALFAAQFVTMASGMGRKRDA
jgi:hypothetical protein